MEQIGQTEVFLMYLDIVFFLMFLLKIVTDVGHIEIGHVR